MQWSGIEACFALSELQFGIKRLFGSVLFSFCEKSPLLTSEKIISIFQETKTPFKREFQVLRGACSLLFSTLLNHFHWGCQRNRTSDSINYTVLLLWKQPATQKRRGEGKKSLEKATRSSWNERGLFYSRLCDKCKRSEEKKKGIQGAVSQRQQLLSPGQVQQTDYLNKRTQRPRMV